MFEIAHDFDAQLLMDKFQISYGVQYEIARGVKNKWWTWADVSEVKLDQLTGPTARAAPKVGMVMRGSKSSSSNHRIW
jgi:RNA-dependent RNA polymerase